MANFLFCDYRQYTWVTLVICTACLLPGCSPRVSTNSNDGSVKDSDGNTYITRAMSDGKQWMTQNLNLNIQGSYCYDDADANCEKYGRLYTWESAKKGCKMLGEAWRLPTNDEWEQMAKHYGGVRTDTGQDGKEAYKSLIEGGASNFNALYSGGRDPNGEYRRIEAHGFYWTATGIDTTSAWFYNLGKNGKILNRHDGEKSGALAVRCIKR